MPANVREKIVFSTPKSYEERTGIARACVRDLGIEIPALVDDFSSTAENAYSGWPDRLYVIGADGRIAYKARPGPFGFKPADMAQTLARLLPG
jgi:iodothyronine deiodinase-like protein